MRDIIALTAPLWLIYALLVGIPSVFVGYFIRRIKPHFSWAVTLGAVIITAVIGVKLVVQQIVEPWLLPGYVVAHLNEKVPHKIDEITTWEWTQFRNGTFIFFYRVTAPASTFESLDPTRIKMERKDSMCKTLQIISELGDFPKLETVYFWDKLIKTVTYDKADCP